MKERKKWLCLLAAMLIGMVSGAADRVTILVVVPAGPGWGEMACLAAVSAGMVATDGEPSVVALPANGLIGVELHDYLRRYKPQRVYAVGAAKQGEDITGEWHQLSGESAVSSACQLSKMFWKTSKVAVICGKDDYESGLMASSIAGRLKAPLLFSEGDALPAETSGELKRLGVGRLITVGRKVKVPKLDVTHLADSVAVLSWVRENGKAEYIAAVNPTDRGRTIIRKLSLAGALLAAARGGVTVPAAHETRWKIPFNGEPLKELPDGITSKKRSSKKRSPKDEPRGGSIKVDGSEFRFVVTVSPYRLYVDLNGDGSFTGPDEGPLKQGQAVTLAGKAYVISMGGANGPSRADVRLTWPSAEEVQKGLFANYSELGAVPELLCLVGFPDALPQAVVPGEPSSRYGDVLTDYLYGNIDEDPFVEIGVARLVGENVSLATLYASRVITYERLSDGLWRKSIGQARWENTYWPLFRNYGFENQYHHDKKDLGWLIEPGPDVKGKRVSGIVKDSPLTTVAAITHTSHSNWKALGQTYNWNSTVLLAPTLVESSGCLTCTLDRDEANKTVVARLMRNGAVGYVGNIRPGIGHQEHLRVAFWNAVLKGETIGKAHLSSQNSMCLEMMDKGQLKRGPLRYAYDIRMLAGDPAFRLRIPARPRVAAAHVVMKNDTVTVHGPAKWWRVSIRVPEDWKLWADKELFTFRGAGTYVSRNWCGAGYDRERHCMNASIRTDRKIKNITQVQQPPEPLGWCGKYWVDEHIDGTRTYAWRVRLLDLNQEKGEVVNKVDQLDYKIEWE